MTLTDRASRAEESPWEDSEDIALEAYCRTGEDLLITVNLSTSVHPDDYEFELYRGEPPMPSKRFRVETRGNVVQLTLQHASRDDAGHYALIAKKLPYDNESERLFSRRVHMSVDEPSFTEEGDPPLFLRRLTDLTVKVGTRTRFLVEIRSATDPKVTWHRNDEPVQEGPRFSFVHEGNFYCVDVAPVTVEDQGHWTCMAENRSGRSSCTSHLNVLVPKAYKRPEFVSELRALLTETGTVSLECKVVGVPTPVLNWFKDDKEIKAGDVFALTANPDDPTSLGTYTCKAVNCMGTAFSSSRVHVVGKGSREGSLKPADTLIVTGDPPIFKKILQDDYCRIGEHLSLSCQVQVPPWPKDITWYNKEGRVEASDRYKIMEDGLGGYSIQVHPVEAVDEGEWKCVATSAENVKQFTTCFVAMSIPKNYRKPRFMESLKAVLTEEGLVSFECKVVGFPTPLLRWFKDGQELKPGDVYQLTGTNSLGSYCCIAKNCMGEAKSTAELTVEDIQNQLNEEERLQLLTTNQPPKFIKGLRSGEAKITESFKFSVQVSVMPEPSLAWYRDDHPVENEEKYRVESETLGTCHLDIQRLEFCDQAEWKCVASNDFGHSITSCFLKLIIPKHYKKPKFLENLRAILSDGGAVNLECKVIGVPQPVLKWYKDGEELKPGDIHRIISGQDGTCCLGTYTCEATNCMGTVSSSASLLGFEDRVSSAQALETRSPIVSQVDHERELARNLSLSTIHEERTSQLLDTAQTDHSITLDDRGEVSFSFDGKEVSVSLYETPDLTEEEALQIVEMYADELSEHVTEHNIVELPPMRFMKESSTSGNLLMEAMVIDVSPDYFVSVDEGDDLRTEADIDDMSFMDGGVSLSSPPTESIDQGKVPTRPPRRKSGSVSSKVQELQESESYHSAKEPLTSLNQKKDDFDIEMDLDSEAFADALSSARTRTESIAVDVSNKKELRKRSISGGSSLEAGDSSFDSTSGIMKKKKKGEKKTNKKQRLGEKGSSEESSAGLEDDDKYKKLLESKVSFADDEDDKSSKTNKDKLVDLLRQISEPVLIVREALIDSDFLLEDDNLIIAFVSDNVVIPIQNLCELVADIETKALKNAGDRSLVQNVRISILETIGGPTEELLRGLELIRRQENDGNIRMNLSILESLVDPVDEILFGLAKLEHELSGRNISESPVILERTIRTTDRLGSSLKEVNNEIGTTMTTALQKIHQTLSAYLNSITLNQFGGWTENIDAVLVESLARPLEDLERSSKYIIQGATSEDTSEEIGRMSDAFNEILSRLDALVVALEGYESDYRTKFVVNLKTSLVAAAEELAKSKDEKSNSLDETHNLPEMILDTLIDAQTAVNAVLHEVEEVTEEEEARILRTSELALSLAELRDAVSYAVHKTTTLRKDETINALINLKEPLIDLQLSLSIDRVPEEISMIKNIVFPLNSLQKVIEIVVQHIEKSDIEISDVIKPIYTIIEELKQQIPMILDDLKHERIKQRAIKTETTGLDAKSAIQHTIDNLQIASELGTVHFELATILEKCEKEIGNIELFPIFSKISDLRQNIGNAAIEIDKISTKVEPNVENFMDELLNLKEPLLKLQHILLTEDSSLEEQQIIVEILKPLERLKAIAIHFAEEVVQSQAITSMINLVDDIKKDITLHAKIVTKNAVEEEFNIKSESYVSIDFDDRGLREKAEVTTIQNQNVIEQASIQTSSPMIIKTESDESLQKSKQLQYSEMIKEASQDFIESDISTESLVDRVHEMSAESPDQIERLDKITDKRVIYPKEEFAFIISQSLEEIQQEILGILEEFEQESVTTPHTVSRLAEALENLRRTILVVRSKVSQIAFEISDVHSESSHAESYESAERISMSLKELLQPILEVREALAQTQDHRAPELLLLNRLDQPIRAIEFNVLQLALEAHSHTVESEETSSRASLDAMARALEDIESQIPVALDEVNSRQEILSILRNVSKPLEVIRERMHEISLDTSNEDNLELDVVNILNEPLDTFRDTLNELFYRMESVDHHDDKNRDATLLLKFLIEPLVELQSSLSVVRSSRRISVADAGLLDERKNVILRAMEEVRFGIGKIRNEINKTDEITSSEKLIISSIDALDSAMVLVENQISKANYTRRSSCLGTLQQRTVAPLQQLAEKIAVIEEQMDESTLDLILEPLETLWKQVQLAQTQFLQSSDLPLDEEAIIEGFLYPVKRLLSSLESVKQNENYTIDGNSVDLLQELGECTSNLGSTLVTLQNELIQEGANEKASVIETLTAVLIPLNNIKQLVIEISQNVRDTSSQTDAKKSADRDKKILSTNEKEKLKDEEKGKKDQNLVDKVPTILTTVETIVDEFIEVSKRETESLTTLKFATTETIGENEKEQYNIDQVETRVAAGNDELNIEKLEEIIPMEKLTKSSIARTVSADNDINAGIEGNTINIMELAADLITERRDSVTALWSLINEPLNNLQQSISLIIESPSVMDAINRGEANTAQDHIIMERLTDLQTSIAAMQQIASDDSEQITITSWQENSLPALQNLAVSLERLGEHLPLLAGQNILTQENAAEAEEIPDTTGVVNALKTLILPLQELREQLGLIVEEQMPYEPKLIDIQTDNIEKKEVSIVNLPNTETVVNKLTDKEEIAQEMLTESITIKGQELKVTEIPTEHIVTEEIVVDETTREIKDTLHTQAEMQVNATEQQSDYDITSNQAYVNVAEDISVNAPISENQDYVKTAGETITENLAENLEHIESLATVIQGSIIEKPNEHVQVEEFVLGESANELKGTVSSIDQQKQAGITEQELLQQTAGGQVLIKDTITDLQELKLMKSEAQDAMIKDQPKEELVTEEVVVNESIPEIKEVKSEIERKEALIVQQSTAEQHIVSESVLKYQESLKEEQQKDTDVITNIEAAEFVPAEIVKAEHANQSEEHIFAEEVVVGESTKELKNTSEKGDAALIISEVIDESASVEKIVVNKTESLTQPEFEIGQEINVEQITSENIADGFQELETSLDTQEAKLQDLLSNEYVGAISTDADVMTKELKVLDVTLDQENQAVIGEHLKGEQVSFEDVSINKIETLLKSEQKIVEESNAEQMLSENVACKLQDLETISLITQKVEVEDFPSKEYVGAEEIATDESIKHLEDLDITVEEKTKAVVVEHPIDEEFLESVTINKTNTISYSELAKDEQKVAKELSIEQVESENTLEIPDMKTTLAGIEETEVKDTLSQKHIIAEEIIPSESTVELKDAYALEDVQKDVVVVKTLEDDKVEFKQISEKEEEILLHSDLDKKNENFETKITAPQELVEDDSEDLQSLQSLSLETDEAKCIIIPQEERILAHEVVSGESTMELENFADLNALQKEAVLTKQSSDERISYENIKASTIIDKQHEQENVEHSKMEVDAENLTSDEKEVGKIRQVEKLEKEEIQNDELNQLKTDEKSHKNQVQIEAFKVAEEESKKHEESEKLQTEQKTEELKKKTVELNEEEDIEQLKKDEGARKKIDELESIKKEGEERKVKRKESGSFEKYGKEYSKQEDEEKIKENDERRQNEKALWSLINEPLTNLQKSLSYIFETPSAIEAINNADVSDEQHCTIADCLTNLNTSIAAIQQIVIDDSQTQVTTAWEENSLPVLQNLALSLEELGKRLPTLAGQSILTQDYTTVTENIPDNEPVASTLKTLITPLHDLSECLELIVEGQISYETVHAKISEDVDHAKQDNKLQIENGKKKESEKPNEDEEESLKKEERRKKEEVEILRNEENERENKKDNEKLKKKDEECKKQEAEKLKRVEEERNIELTEKVKKDEEERKKKENENLKKEEEERKREEAEKLKTAEEECKNKYDADRLKKEEEGRKKKEEADNLKKQEEECRKKEEAENLKKAEVERKKKEDAKKLKEEEERKKKEADENIKKEEEECKKKEEAERNKKEEEERKKIDEADKLRKLEEERKQKEEADKLKKEEEERKRKEDAENIRKEEEEHNKKKEAEKLKNEEEERKKKDEANQLKKEKEELKKREEAEKLKIEEEERRKKEEAERIKKEEEERKKKDEADKLRILEEERRQKEEADKLKKEEEERKRKEDEEKIRKEEEERQKEEAEKLRNAEEERKKEEEKQERKKKEEAEKLKKEEEERKKKEEAEKQRKEEEERKKKEEAEKQKKEEEERKKKEEDEQERKKKEEAEKLKKEEEERKKKEEAEKQKKDEAEKLKIEEERKMQEVERLKIEEEECKKKEAEKLKNEEEERKKKDEADKLKNLEEERKRKEEADKLKGEEAHKKDEDAEKSRKEEEERRTKEETEKLKKEEEERKKNEEAEKQKKEENERKKKKEAEKQKKEEEERKQKVEADKLKEEEERKQKEDADNVREKEEERKKKKETEKVKEEEEERQNKETAEKLKKVEEERKKQEAEENKKREKALWSLIKEPLDNLEKSLTYIIETPSAVDAINKAEANIKQHSVIIESFTNMKISIAAVQQLISDDSETQLPTAWEANSVTLLQNLALSLEGVGKRLPVLAGQTNATQDFSMITEKMQANEPTASALKILIPPLQELRERLEFIVEEQKHYEIVKTEKEERKKKELEKLEKEEEERKKKEESAKIKKEEEERKKKEDKRLKVEEEERKKTEAEKLKKEEEERKKKEDAEKSKKEEEEREKKENADKLKKKEEERKKKEAEKLKKEEEEERKKKEEDEKLMKEEEECKNKEEAERLKKEEEERKKKEAEKLKKEEEERKKKEEEERKKKEEAEKLKKEEEERKKKEETVRLKVEEEDRKKKEETERLKAEEEERKKKEETERLKAEEEERKNKEAEKLKKEGEERKKKEEAEKLKKEEQERKKKEETEKLKKEEQERKKKEETEKLKKEEEERKKKEEAEKQKKDEAEKLKIEEAERLQIEEEERKKKEAEKLKKEEEGRKKKEGADTLKKEKEERRRKKDAENVKKDEEEVRKKEEAEILKKKEDVEKLKIEEKKRIKDDAENLNRDDEQRERKDAVMIKKEKEHKKEDAAKVKEIETSVKLKGERKRLDEGRQLKDDIVISKKKDETDDVKRGGTSWINGDAGKTKDYNKWESGITVLRDSTSRSEESSVSNDIGQRKRLQSLGYQSATAASRNESKYSRESPLIYHKESLKADSISRTARDIKTNDYSYARDKNALSYQYTKFNSDSFYNRYKIDKETPSRNDYKKATLNERLDSLSDLTRLRPKKETKFLSRSRDDLLRRDYDLRSSYPPLYTGTSIPDLTSTAKSLYNFDLGRKYEAYSTSSLNLETESKKRSFARSYESFKKDFEHPTYTPKSYQSNDYSMSVSDSLALSRSRRRFESRNTAVIYEGFSGSLSPSRNRSVDRGKFPTFCTKLTNCTVAEGSHIRLICTTIGQPEPQVYWTKNGDRVRPGGRERIKFENGMATLEITAAELEDSGYYSCVAKNTYGQSSTEATVRVYSVYESSPMGPTFTSAMNDKYKLSDRELILETRVRGQPTPSISWLKDERILRGERYRQSLLGDGVCRLQISNPDISDSGQYVCKATSDKTTDQIRHMVHFDGFENRKIRPRKDYVFDSRLYDSGREREKLPRISTSLADYKVPAGGTIALQVEIKDALSPNVTWLRDRGERKEPISSPKIRTFAESGIYTLIVPEATESEAGTYVCRVSNAYGHVDTSATVEVIPLSKFDDLGKPAMFVSRPAEKVMYAMDGEAVSVSFRMSGTPRPRVVWMKGIRDITDGPRSQKENVDDYVRLTLNRINPEDEGTYCILVKNCYGCDRSFFTLKVRQRARSLTPTAERLSLSDRLSDIHIKEQQSYLRNVPGPISSEPIVVDGGRNWLSLSWGKADQRGPAPVIAYRVDAWQMGGDGGARWVELGISPINSFDAFNLRPGGEYKFRVTPRNRYGWGESVTMNGSATVSEDVEIPEFTKILPGQLKALAGSTVNLECEARSDSKFDVKWLRETTEIDSSIDSRYIIKNERSKCSLVLKNINEDDSGRYICEISNKAGKVSSYGRILVVNDPKILHADTRLKKRFLDGLVEDGPPQFTMRLRDRRVQVSYPVRLTCQVFGYPEPEVSWFKDGKAVSETSTRSIYIDESHFHTLEIAHSCLEDSGCYEACAKNVNGSVSCRCVLVVDKGIRAYIAPEFLYGLDVAYAVKVGGDLRLTAQIEAYPSVGIVWHRDGIRLRPRRRGAMSLSHDGTVDLLLTNVSGRDAGVYTCTATNEVGKAETSTRVSVMGPDDSVVSAARDDSSLHVIVNQPDVDVPYSKVPLFMTKPLSTEAQEGDTVIIQCEVVGDPKPEVMWLRDFLKPDYYRDAAHFRRVGAGPQYSLEIPHAKLDYTGTYSVLARNEHGEAKAVISLQIYAKGQGKSGSMDQNVVKQGEILSVPSIKSELKDIRCCDGDAVTLECQVYAPSEPPNIRWEKCGKALPMDGDFSAEFDGETAKLIIRHVYPEDEGEYTCVATNELGKAFTSACLVVDVPEGKENVLSQPRLTRPQGLISANSTPRSTPRSTPVRSLSPGISRGRELKALNLPRRIDAAGSFRRKPKICPPKFYTIPHNRVAEEGETVRFQCAVAGHPTPWSAWDKDGVPVTSSARITVKEKDDVRILEIAEVTLEDVGLYRVTLENDVGRTEATARLEIINRNTLTPRPIRTRSASPRTYPTFSRSLLSTTTRLNGRLQLQCDIRGSPSPSTAWFRNGSRIERSARIKRSFVGERAVLDIAGVKHSDAGEYVCEAKNLLGTTRSSCKVVVLDSDDPSTMDCEPPKFLQTIPGESLVMEGHSYELQTRLSGTSPFTILWLKDGHEVIDSDYYRHVIYEDGGVALRFLNVHPLDAGDYTCIARNDHGEATCRGLFVVQDYKSASSNSMLSFVKTPVPVFAEKGETACFCARIQSDRSVDVDWTINGKSVREDYRCKIERDGSTSILRIPCVTQRDCGEIRCIASITRGPSISSSAQLRLKPFSPSRLLKCLEPRSRSLPRSKDGSVPKSNGLSTPNLRIDKNSVDAKKRASSFTRLSSKTRESSVESVCEKPPISKMVNKKIRKRSIEKPLAILNGKFLEKKHPGKDPVAKKDVIPLESVEITIEPVEKVHLSIEPVEKVHVPIDPVFDEDEIDESIVEILAKENIILPIETLITTTKQEPNLGETKLPSPVRETSKERVVSIKRISSFKNSRSSPTMDILDRDAKSNHHNNNNEDEHSDKEARMYPDRKPPPSPRTWICDGQDMDENEIALPTLKQPTRGISGGRKEVPALVLRPPDDVITLRGSAIALEAAYQGHPEPSVKWMRAGRELVADERTHIDSAAGLSRLTLVGITADQAGKYAVAVENALGSDCRFASVAVEGPPEPPCDPPSVSPVRRESGDYGANVTWCSPAYDGGCALTGYTVECRRIGELCWRVVAENCHSLSYEAGGLHAGATYLFRVRALNIHGPGDPSPESRPFKVPFLDMDTAEDKLKVEEDQANMEDENGEDDSTDKIVTPEEGHLFKERYALHEELGKGRYGVVKRVVEKKSAKSYAAKIVRTVKTSDRQQVREEMKIMNLLRHPKLLRLTAAFESPKEIVMVTEYISGGELFERVVADDFTLTEKDSILFMRQICEGVRYMHENNVVHLDLKPENIMCHTRTSHRIKLIDFGLAQILSPSKPVRVLFGTPEFIPPEIINYEPIGTESDMWSVGVICYVLLTGLSPFMGDNDAETFANIVRADYDFEDEAFDAISPDAKDFISNLLQKKKELRMSAKQCLSHSWLAQHTENMSRVALPTDKLKKFIVRRKWQPIRMRTQG